jgi:hypothetical protein
MADKDPWDIKPSEIGTVIGHIKRLVQIAERSGEPELDEIKQALMPDNIWISDFVPMSVDDMAAIGGACSDKAAVVAEQYRCIVAVINGGLNTGRCGLPKELANLSTEELEEQRIPWGDYAWTFACWAERMKELADKHHPMKPQ